MRNGQPPLLSLQEFSDGTKVLIQQWETWIKPLVFLKALPCNPGVWHLYFVLVKPLQILSQFLWNLGNNFLSTITIALGSHQSVCPGQGFKILFCFTRLDNIKCFNNSIIPLHHYNHIMSYKLLIFIANWFHKGQIKPLSHFQKPASHAF